MVNVDLHKGPQWGHCDPNIVAADQRASKNLSCSLFETPGWQNVKQAWCKVTDALFLEMHIHKKYFLYYSTIICSCLPNSSRNFV